MADAATQTISVAISVAKNSPSVTYDKPSRIAGVFTVLPANRARIKTLVVSLADRVAHYGR